MLTIKRLTYGFLSHTIHKARALCFFGRFVFSDAIPKDRWKLKPTNKSGTPDNNLRGLNTRKREYGSVESNSILSSSMPNFWQPLYILYLLLVFHSFTSGVVEAQVLPKSYKSERDSTRFELTFANEFRRQAISLAYHEFELRESEYLKNQQFVDSLGLSGETSRELRSLLSDYKFAIRSLREDIGSGKSSDEFADQVATTADEIREWYETKLSTEQKTIAKAIAFRHQVLCNGIRNTLQTGKTFRWFNEAIVVEPVAEEELQTFSQYIQREWVPNSQAAIAATIDVLLNGTDQTIIDFVKDRVLQKSAALPIELCIVRMKGITPPDKNVARDLKWIRTGNNFSFRIGVTGQFEHGVRIQGEAFPLAILLSDRTIRERMKMDLLPQQIDRISQHFQVYSMEVEPLFKLAKTKPEDSKERRDLERSIHQIGGQYSELVEAELLPAQWQQLVSVSRTRLIYEHGLYAAIESELKEFEVEHKTEIDREALKQNSVKAQKQLDQEVARLESHYRSILRSEIGESNRELFSLFELAMVHTKEPCLSLFVFGSTHSDRGQQ